MICVCQLTCAIYFCKYAGHGTESRDHVHTGPCEQARGNDCSGNASRCRQGVRGDRLWVAPTQEHSRVAAPVCGEASQEAAVMPVYFIRMGDDGPVKIGYTKDVPARMNALQTASPYPLVLMRQIPGGAAAEHWLHRLFADLRLQREWFQYDPRMATVVPDSSHGADTSRPDIVSYFLEHNCTLQAAGTHFGVTREYVRQVVKKAGISQRCGRALKPPAPPMGMPLFDGLNQIPMAIKALVEKGLSK